MRTMLVKAWEWRKYKHYQGSVVWNFSHNPMTGYWMFILTSLPGIRKRYIKFKVSH